MKKEHMLEIILVIVVLGLAAFLRLVNLADNPGWYTDEGTHLNIANNLLAGRVQYMAVGESTLLFARLPLFEILLAGCMALFGSSMLTLRTVTALLGVVTVGLGWLMLRRTTHNRVLALSGACSLAIYPTAILYSRWGFSYNLLSVFFLLALWSLSEFQQSQQQHWLWLGAVALGLGCISDVAGLILLVPFVLMLIWLDWRQLRWVLPVSLVPFILYLLWQILFAPEAFVYDWNYTFNRVDVALPDQFWNIARSYTILLTQDIRFLGGLVGLFLLQPKWGCWLGLSFALLPMILIGRVVPLYGLSAYYLIPVLPLIGLGFGVFVYQAAVYLYQLDLSDWPAWLTRAQWSTPAIHIGLVCILIGVPLVVELDETARRIQSSWVTPIETSLVEADTATSATAYINQHLAEGETVILSPTLAWQIEGNVVDFITAPAELTSAETYRFGFDIEIPRDRFVYDPRYASARFAVIDNLWRDWGVNNVPGVAAMLDDIQANWTLVWQMGSVAIYENPKPHYAVN